MFCVVFVFNFFTLLCRPNVSLCKNAWFNVKCILFLNGAHEIIAFCVHFLNLYPPINCCMSPRLKVFALSHSGFCGALIIRSRRWRPDLRRIPGGQLWPIRRLLQTGRPFLQLPALNQLRPPLNGSLAFGTYCE